MTICFMLYLILYGSNIFNFMILVYYHMIICIKHMHLCVFMYMVQSVLISFFTHICPAFPEPAY